jgi:tetraacyldisaccharide 4'-kinase
MSMPLPYRLILSPFALVYGAAARLHAWLYAQGIYTTKHLTTPVISVGNLTVGGTGKTPMVIWLTERFLAEGKHVGILSRGYQGSGGTSDEIEMMKERLGDRVVFGVGADRYIEGRRIEAEEPVNVFLLDDGFQHLELARDVDIVLVDSTTFDSTKWLLPAGSMREPLSALRRASAVVLTRTSSEPSDSTAGQAIRKVAADLPTFFAETKLLGYRCVSNGRNGQAAQEDKLPPQPVFAFCGIGNPSAFFSDLKRWGIVVVGQHIFADHHSYTAHDEKILEAHAQRAGAKALMTTEKDIQNLKKVHFAELPLYCCQIALEIGDEQALCLLLKNKIASCKRVEA